MTVMTIKRILSIAAVVAASVNASWAFDMHADSTTINLNEVNVKVDETGRSVTLRLGLDAADFKVSRDRQMILTPVLMADDHSDSLLLEPIIIAGRNRWYYYQRSGILDDGEEPIYRAGRTGKIRYSEEFALQPWMEAASLEMRVATSNCCDAPELMPGESPNGMVPIARIDLARPAFSADYVMAAPADRGPVTRNIEGRAFVTFVVNRTELKPDYMINRQELGKIINSIEYVRKDKDATITHVHIKGFASPEGPYDNNVRLAQGRTETLRRYVRDLYNFADTTVSSSYEPEDWAGLRAYVADSMQFDIKHRAEILDIIDSNLAPDPKNSAIQKQFPADYQVILKQIYPWLRHSDYTVKYIIRVYATLEEIRRVFAEDPARLRAVDFYTLAQSYPEWSADYVKVYETAVKVYPDDPILNLNAANVAMHSGNYDLAQSYLHKAGNSPQADFARGVLAAKRGDARGALELFTKAKAAGVAGADQAIANVRAILDYHPVTYYINGK